MWVLCVLSTILFFSLAGKGGCQGVLCVLDSRGQVWRWWALWPGDGWQDGSPCPLLLTLTMSVANSGAPAMCSFNDLTWRFGCVLLCFMALVNQVSSVKSRMHTRASSREEEEEWGLHILVAQVFRIGSAILPKNTNRLCWDVITARGLYRHYTLWYGFPTAIILTFGHSGSLIFFNPFPVSNYRLFLQTFPKGLGQDVVGKRVLMQLCNNTLMWSFSWVQNILCLSVFLHPPIQRSIYMKCQSPCGIIWELIICGEWFGPINYGSHRRKRIGLMCHMIFFSQWTRNSSASNINNGFVEYRLMTSDRNYRRNLYHFVLL